MHGHTADVPHETGGDGRQQDTVEQPQVSHWRGKRPKNNQIVSSHMKVLNWRGGGGGFSKIGNFLPCNGSLSIM